MSSADPDNDGETAPQALIEGLLFRTAATDGADANEHALSESARRNRRQTMAAFVAEAESMGPYPEIFVRRNSNAGLTRPTPPLPTPSHQAGAGRGGDGLRSQFQVATSSARDRNDYSKHSTLADADVDGDVSVRNRYTTRDDDFEDAAAAGSGRHGGRVLSARRAAAADSCDNGLTPSSSSSSSANASAGVSAGVSANASRMGTGAQGSVAPSPRNNGGDGGTDNDASGAATANSSGGNASTPSDWAGAPTATGQSSSSSSSSSRNHGNRAAAAADPASADPTGSTVSASASADAGTGASSNTTGESSYIVSIIGLLNALRGCAVCPPLSHLFATLRVDQRTWRLLARAPCPDAMAAAELARLREALFELVKKLSRHAEEEKITTALSRSRALAEEAAYAAKLLKRVQALRVVLGTRVGGSVEKLKAAAGRRGAEAAPVLMKAVYKAAMVAVVEADVAAAGEARARELEVGRERMARKQARRERRMRKKQIKKEDSARRKLAKRASAADDVPSSDDSDSLLFGNGDGNDVSSSSEESASSGDENSHDGNNSKNAERKSNGDSAANAAVVAAAPAPPVKSIPLDAVALSITPAMLRRARVRARRWLSYGPLGTPSASALALAAAASVSAGTSAAATAAAAARAAPWRSALPEGECDSEELSENECGVSEGHVVNAGSIHNQAQRVWKLSRFGVSVGELTGGAAASAANTSSGGSSTSSGASLVAGIISSAAGDDDGGDALSLNLTAAGLPPPAATVNARAAAAAAASRAGVEGDGGDWAGVSWEAAEGARRLQWGCPGFTDGDDNWIPGFLFKRGLGDWTQSDLGDSLIALALAAKREYDGEMAAKEEARRRKAQQTAAVAEAEAAAADVAAAMAAANGSANANSSAKKANGAAASSHGDSAEAVAAAAATALARNFALSSSSSSRSSGGVASASGSAFEGVWERLLSYHTTAVTMWREPNVWMLRSLRRRLGTLIYACKLAEEAVAGYLAVALVDTTALTLAALLGDAQGQLTATRGLTKIGAHWVRAGLPLLAQLLSVEPTVFPQNVLRVSFAGIESGPHWAPARQLVRQVAVLRDLLAAVDVHVLPRGIQAHSGAVKASGPAALSASYVLTGGQDGALRVWNLPRAECVAQLIGHTSGVSWCALTEVDATVISTSLDGTVKLWEAKTGACLATLADHGDGILCADISANGRYLVTGSMDCTLRLWGVSQSGQTCLRVYEGHQHWVTAVRFTADGASIVSCGLDKQIFVWPFKTNIGASSAAGSKAGKSAAGSAAAAAANAGGPLQANDLHRDFVSYLLPLGGSKMLSVARDQTAKMWCTQTGQVEGTLPNPNSQTVSAAAISPNRKLIALGMVDYTVTIYDSATGSPLRHLKVHCEGISHMRFTTNKSLLVGTTDGRILTLEL